MNDELKIKQQLYSECVNYVESKITLIAKCVDELQQASMLETKSSMAINTKPQYPLFILR